jgi:type IV pilus assembly protein PilO
MAFGINDQRSRTFALITALAVMGGYGVFAYLHQPLREQITSVQTELHETDSVVAMAKVELARGSKDEVERQVESYGGMLSIMRQLVPDQNEVPTLIDDLSNRAKIRGITIDRFQPMDVERGSPFDTYRYRWAVFGRFDEIGEFLSDVASLPRIMVPEDLALRPAQQQAQRVQNDTTGALLEATFSIRTFVKAAAAPPRATPPRRGR